MWKTVLLIELSAPSWKIGCKPDNLFRVADLEFKTYVPPLQLALIFISTKQGEKIFGSVLPVTRL